MKTDTGMLIPYRYRNRYKIGKGFIVLTCLTRTNIYFNYKNNLNPFHYHHGTFKF